MTDAAMTEPEFHELIDETFQHIETVLDKIDEDPDSDLDYENGAGVLTIKFDNGTTMVFSRQPPTRQLWLATRGGGFHFVYDEEAQDWRNTRDGTWFRPFVVAQMRDQAGLAFSWEQP